MTEESRRQVGVAATVTVAVVLLGFALTVDFPAVSQGFHGDEATYYMLAHSLAEDGDFTYEREDLARVWEEFPGGPEGIFLKRGVDVDVGWEWTFPFVRWETTPEAIRAPLFYGKSYIYPLVAAPFVWLFGTGGFLVLHALLLAGAFGAVYALLALRSGAAPALLFTAAFFLGSVVPVYFVMVTPELFNVALVCYAAVLWGYKEVAATSDTGSGPVALSLTTVGTFMRSRWSDCGAPLGPIVGVMITGTGRTRATGAL